jgi:glycosyltransferase involved in cell wall biosynthesis
VERVPQVPLSVLVTTYNEAHNIADCLAGVSWADEILVVDSGSRDRTREIAAQAGARVVEHPYESAARQKNWAIPQLRHSWVLILDADERVPPALAAEIRARIAEDGAAGGAADGYSMRRESTFLGVPIRHAGWGQDRVLRLFRRDRGRYDDVLVHESLELQGRAARLQAPLLHFTYRSLDDYLEKLGRYTARGAADLRTRGKRVSLATLCWRPPARFLRMYVLQAGFLAGGAGLVLCLLTAYSVWLKYAQRWEEQRREKEHEERPAAISDAVALRSGG